MRVFVTGATGLIGASAVRALIAAGHEVFGLTSRAEKKSALEQLGARAIVGDMRDASAYRMVAREADAIVHAAATMPNKLRYSARDVDRFTAEDAGAVEALLSVIGRRCKLLLYSSGSWVYGDTGPYPVDEAHSTDEHHVMMRRKLETESRLLELARAGTTPAVIVRPALVLGAASIWRKLYLDAMLRGKRAMIPGSGRNMVSFVHAEDVGNAYRLLVEKALPGDIYNVADDEPAALRDVVTAQARALATPPPATVPGFVVRFAAGPFTGPPLLADNAISNRKLKLLGFACRHPTYREGVVAVAAALVASRPDAPVSPENRAQASR